MAPSQLTSRSALLSPTIYNDLCKQKASYVAHHSVSAAGNIRVAMFFMIWPLGFALLLLAIQVKRDQPSLTKTLRQTIGATVLMALIGFCFATYVLSVQHEFYCEVSPIWNNWNREWLITGFVFGYPTAISLANWVFVMVHGRSGKSREEEEGDELPYGFWMILAPLFVILLAGAGVLRLVCGAESSPTPASSNDVELALAVQEGPGLANDARVAEVAPVGGAVAEACSIERPVQTIGTKVGEGGDDQRSAKVDDASPADGNHSAPANEAIPGVDVRRPEETHSGLFPHRKTLDDMPPPYNS